MDLNDTPTKKINPMMTCAFRQNRKSPSNFKEQNSDFSADKHQFLQNTLTRWERILEKLPQGNNLLVEPCKRLAGGADKDKIDGNEDVSLAETSGPISNDAMQLERLEDGDSAMSPHRHSNSISENNVDKILDCAIQNLQEAGKALATLGENHEHEIKLMVMDVLAKFQKWIDIIQKKFDKAKYDVNSIRKALVTQKIVVAAQEQELVALRAKLAECETNKAIYEKKLTECETNKANFEKKLAQCESNKANFEKQLAQCETNKANCEKKLAEIQAKATERQQLAASNTLNVATSVSKTSVPTTKATSSHLLAKPLVQLAAGTVVPVTKVLQLNGDSSTSQAPLPLSIPSPYSNVSKNPETVSVDEPNAAANTSKVQALAVSKNSHSRANAMNNRIRTEIPSATPIETPGNQLKEPEQNLVTAPGQSNSSQSKSKPSRASVVSLQVQGTMTDESTPSVALPHAPTVNQSPSNQNRDEEQNRVLIELKAELLQLRNENEKIKRDHFEYENAMQRALLQGVSSLNAEALKVLKSPPFACYQPCEPCNSSQSTFLNDKPANIQCVLQTNKGRKQLCTEKHVSLKAGDSCRIHENNVCVSPRKQATTVCYTPVKRSSQNSMVFLVPQHHTDSVCTETVQHYCIGRNYGKATRTFPRDRVYCASRVTVGCDRFRGGLIQNYSRTREFGQPASHKNRRFTIE